MNMKLQPLQKSPQDPFRVVVAGCGGMARVWIEYTLARPDATIVGLVDLDLAQAEKTAAEHGLKEAELSASLSDCLAKTRPDLVYVLATPAAHQPLAATALEAGCAVFLEKPLAASLSEARALVRLAEAKGLPLAVMQNRRYLKQIRAMQHHVACHIGTPGFLSADFFLGPHFGGFRDAMDSPLLLDMAIHTFDQARLICGQDAATVYCHEFNPPGSWYRGHACAAAIFEMSDGLVFDYRGSWCAEGSPTSWESSWRATGSEGTAIWDGLRPPYAESKPQDGREGDIEGRWLRLDDSPCWPDREGHAGCLDAMYQALLQGRPAETNARDNLKSLAMVEAAIESARSGQKVRVEGMGEEPI